MNDDNEYIKIAIWTLRNNGKMEIVANALNYLCNTETTWTSKQLAKTLRQMVKNDNLDSEVNKELLDTALFGLQEWELVNDY